jgi:hypothetical protein
MLKHLFPSRLFGRRKVNSECAGIVLKNTYRLIVSGGVDSELSLISTEKPRRRRHRK